MLPLSLLNAATGSPLLVELKGGESVNGFLISCDSWMNVMLRDAVVTSADAQTFKKVPEIFLKGTLIKYVRVPDSLLEAIKEERQIKREERREQERQEREKERRPRNNQRRNNRQHH